MRTAAIIPACSRFPAQLHHRLVHRQRKTCFLMALVMPWKIHLGAGGGAADVCPELCKAVTRVLASMLDTMRYYCWAEFLCC